MSGFFFVLENPDYFYPVCGIAGFVDYQKTSSEEILRKMTDALAHRGPDSAGYQLFNQDKYQIGLGHRRLAIIELSELGAQPKSFEHWSIVFNGEIYNHHEIRIELEQKGYDFESDSDTEVILKSFDAFGIEAIHKFIGMFAFCMLDGKNEKLYFVRDRAGVKPLFLYSDQGLTCFSSELKSFHEHPRFKKEINKSAVAAFMQYGNVPTPHCIFENCIKIKPGHYVELDLKSGKTTENQYWNVYDSYNADKLDISYSEAIQETKSLLKSAFKYRMVSDVPVGVFLSGGFDSTAVASILQEETSERIKTFTIGVPDIGLNEAQYAKETSQILGTEHHELTCTAQDAIDLIPTLPWFYDEPFADSSALPTMLVSKMAREHVTVALSSDAGDELFAGYNRYDYLHRYGKKMNRIPAFARKATANMMNLVPSEKLPYLRNKYNFHNRYEKLKNILRNPSDERIMESLSQQFTDQQIKNVMKADFSMLSTSYQSKELISNYSALSYMMAVDYQTYLLDDILQKVDRATMSVSLEGREPFLDHRVLEFAARLPNDFKYSDGIKKRILRDIVYEYVPKEKMDRPKMGFAIPIASWLQNELRPLVEEYCSTDRLKEHGLFNEVIIEKLLRDFYLGKKEYDFKVWYLLMFQMWYDKWMKS